MPHVAALSRRFAERKVDDFFQKSRAVLRTGNPWERRSASTGRDFQRKPPTSKWSLIGVASYISNPRFYPMASTQLLVVWA